MNSLTILTEEWTIWLDEKNQENFEKKKEIERNIRKEKKNISR